MYDLATLLQALVVRQLDTCKARGLDALQSLATVELAGLPEAVGFVSGKVECKLSTEPSIGLGERKIGSADQGVRIFDEAFV